MKGYVAMNAKNKCPFIFVHGMFGWGDSIGINKVSPYWGSTTGDLIKYMNSRGYECYAASVGPVSSAWDNACELYAQLTGTRVDYGAAHSKAHGHERFGRTYKKPLFEGFCETGIHLIGHSHGGQVARLLAHLLTYGDKSEIEAAGEDNVSSLFTGGKESLILSVTSVCTPNNGTTLYEMAEEANIVNVIGSATDFLMALIGRTFLHGRFVDYQLEQYGLTPLRGEKKADKIFNAMNKLRDGNDHVLSDLSFKGAYELNSKIEISSNITYFCYTASAVEGENNTPKNVTCLPLKPLCKLIANHELPRDEYSFGINSSWRENDGLVNTVSGRNPIDEPARIFDGNIEKGIWNIMPTLACDHGRAAGLLADKDELRKFYSDHAEMLISIEN